MNRIRYREVIKVCDVRHLNSLNCRDCKYYGAACESVKRKYPVKKPYEVIDFLEVKYFKDKEN